MSDKTNILLFPDSLGGLFEGVADTILAEDPWGFTAAEVLRSDHPEWCGFIDESGLTALAKKIERAGRLQVMRRGLKAQMKGVRKTVAPAPKAIDSELEAMEDDLLSLLTDDDLVSLSEADDLEDLKPGIATVLLRSLTAKTPLRGPDGVDLDPEHISTRLRLMGWDGFMVDLPDGRQMITRKQLKALQGEPTKSELVQFILANAGTTKVQEFTGNPRNGAGQLLRCAAGQPFAGEFVGDAFAKFWLGEAKKAEIRAVGVLQAVAENLGDTPAGEVVT